MDAIELLTSQHREVEGLFDEFRAAAADARRSLADTIVRELRLHTTIEEELFYPVVREQGGELEADVLEDLEEHHAVEMLLDELEGMSPEDERFAAKALVIEEMVQHHVEEEEEEQFPKVREALGDDLLADLGAQMERRYEDLKADAEAQTTSKEEWYRRAQELGIEGRSQMSKRQLADAVRASQS